MSSKMSSKTRLSVPHIVSSFRLLPATLGLLACGTALVVSGATAQAPNPLLSAQTTPAAPAAAKPAPVTKPAAPAKDPTALTFKTPNATRGASFFSANCAACHGAGGVSTKDTTPSLAGQVPNYLQVQLAFFRAKIRPSDIMQHVAAKLSDQDIVDVSAYLSAQQPGPAWKADAAARTHGAKLFTSGDPARNLLACAVCHGESGRGLNANHIASIANLPPKYAVAILKDFRDTPTFGGSVPAETMRIATHPLTDSELNDLAAYISSIK